MTLILLAQAAQAVEAAAGFNWTMLAVNLPGYALIMWLIYHKTSVADPAKDRAHGDQLDKAWLEVGKQRTVHEAHIEALVARYLASEKQSRDDFMNALTTQRTDFRDSIRAMSEALTRLTETTLLHVNDARTVWQQRPIIVPPSPAALPSAT